MRLVVFADSHGNYAVLRRIIQLQAAADGYIHLGDNVRDFTPIAESYPEKLTCSVRGNNDWDADVPLMNLLVLENKRVLFTHGHNFNVKRSNDLLLEEAKERKADIVLYGHTHMPYTGYVGGIYLLNPGSVSVPLDGRPTYGVVDITAAGVVTRVVEL